MKQISYLRWLKIQNYRRASIRTLKSLVHRLENYLIKEGLSINQEAIESYVTWVENQGYSSVYQYQLYWGLGSYLAYLQQIKDIELKLSLPKFKKKTNRRKALKAEQLAKINTWLHSRVGEKDYPIDALLWLLFYGLGLRRSEACQLKLSDVQKAQKLLKVRSLKGVKARYLPLSSSQIQVFLSYINEQRPIPKKGLEQRLILSPRGLKANNYLGSRLSYWQEQTGLGAALCWHVLRHSIASQLAQKGMEIELISQFLGHRCISSTAHYLHYQS